MDGVKRLANKGKQGDLAVLVGMDLPESVTGVPSRTALARGLAARFSKPASDSLVSIATSLNPWQYAGYLAQALAVDGGAGPLHRAVASLPVPFLMTSAYDGRLAQALSAAGKPFNLLLDDTDVTNRQPDRADLIKLCGDVGPNKQQLLVVSEAQYTAALQQPNRAELYGRVAQWLAQKTVLILGCDPSPGSDFDRWLYREILQYRNAFQGGAVLVWPHPTPQDKAHWLGRNVALVEGEPSAFVALLGRRLSGVSVAVTDQEQLALERMARTLFGSATRHAVDDAKAALPHRLRPQSARMTFRLWLDEEDAVESMLDIDYDPDIAHYHRPPRKSTITLDVLRQWAEEAHEELEAWERPDDGPVQDTGMMLYDHLMPTHSERRKQYEFTLQYCQMLGLPLDIVFELLDVHGRLSPVPWELLYDKHVTHGRGFLGLEYPVYRLPDAVSSVSQVAGDIKKALIAGVDPTAQLDALNAEVTALRQLLEAGGVAVDVRTGTDPALQDRDAFTALLRGGGYQLLHFTGHGQFNRRLPEQSFLLLGQSGAEAERITAAELGRVARDTQLILVFLSACEVGRTAADDEERPWLEAGMVDALTRNGVPAAVGMRWEVGDQNGMAVAERFYEELLNGASPQKALMLARQAINDQPDWVNPILTKLHGVL